MDAASSRRAHCWLSTSMQSIAPPAAMATYSPMPSARSRGSPSPRAGSVKDGEGGEEHEPATPAPLQG